MASDRNLKTRFRDLDGEEVLRKLAGMPIQEWTYIAAPGVRHVGPMAQDFTAAFALGDDPLRISTIDPAGIALRAVQALDERTRDSNERLRVLERENAELRAELEAIKTMLRKQ